MEDKDKQTLLLAMYKENCDQARHHEGLREKVTTIVGQTAGVVIGLFGFKESWSSPQPIHLLIPTFVILLGIWGFTAAWKHNERAAMHRQRIRQCRRMLSELSGIDLKAMNDRASVEHLAEFGPNAEYEARTHIIWKAFNVLIALLGTVLFVAILARL
jgi:hypothetical protein